MDGAPFTPSLNHQIRTFIESRFPLVAAEGLADDASLFETGAIDSLGLLDVVGFFEEDLSIAISDDDMEPENFESITEMTRFAERKRG
ncbi:MAG: acyl carrier protein [Hyphomicrobiaceae bacterium]|jgi:acyl carrier protein